MMSFIKDEPEVVQRYITELYNQRPVYSNYYPFNLSETEYIKTAHSLVIRKLDNYFYRLYILSTDKNDLAAILSKVEIGHVINIPSKKEITLWDQLLREVGFRQTGVYKRYYNTNIIRWGDFEDNYACGEDLEVIYRVLYEHFDPIMDRLPDRIALGNMIVRQQVLVNRSEGQVSGVFIFTPEGRKCYFNAWRDTKGDGIQLLLNVYNMMYHRHLNYAYFWIREGNVFVERIHQKLGARFDGLVDYTYLK